MPTIHEDIQAVLESVAPAGGVWYGENTGQAVTFPFITWMFVVATENVALEGPSDLQNYRIQVDVLSTNAAQCLALHRQARAAMIAPPLSAVPLQAQDLPEDAIRVYRKSQDFSIWATN